MSLNWHCSLGCLAYLTASMYVFMHYTDCCIKCSDAQTGFEKPFMAYDTLQQAS